MNTVNININIILNREENHLYIHDSYLEIEFFVSDNACDVFANDANVRLVNYGMMALLSSIKLETSGGRIGLLNIKITAILICNCINY